MDLINVEILWSTCTFFGVMCGEGTDEFENVQALREGRECYLRSGESGGTYCVGSKVFTTCTAPAFCLVL
jgi:hypothetical protein